MKYMFNSEISDAQSTSHKQPAPVKVAQMYESGFTDLIQRITNG